MDRRAWLRSGPALLAGGQIAIIEEAQPRWGAFLSGDLDMLAVPPEFAPLAMSGGILAPFLQRRQVQLQRTLAASSTRSYFNLDDPVVGGHAPHGGAGLGQRAGDPPGAQRRGGAGAEPDPAALLRPRPADAPMRSEMSTASLPRAAALLDLCGYTDRNGDGWRERPDGSPLVLRLAAGTTQRSRRTNELWRKRLNAVGLKIEFEVGPFGHLIKRALAGQSNDARFRWPAYDGLYERQRVLPDGPERLGLMQAATRMMLARVPYIAHHYPYVADLSQPRVLGHRRHPFTGHVCRHTALVTAHS